MSDQGNFSIQGYNLVTLLKRLEAATSRLEDVTIFQESKSAAAVVDATAATTSVEPTAPKSTMAPSSAIAAAPRIVSPEVPKSIKEFDNFIKEKIDPYVQLSQEIDGQLGEQAELFKEAIDRERRVLLAASKSEKLNAEDGKFQELVIKPINELIMKIISIKDGNRNSEKFNYLNAVSEGVAVLGWIVVNTPVSYVPEFKDSAQFWTNRILKEVKGSEDEKVGTEWVKTFLSIFDALKDYVKEFHSTGITWGGSQDFEDAIKTGDEEARNGGSGGSTSSVPPPPPPPPPADLFVDEVAAAKNGGSNGGGANKVAVKSGGMGAVFEELNQGEKITSGLRKVDKSEMTHKNPELRRKSGPMPPKKPKKFSSSGNSTSTSGNDAGANAGAGSSSSDKPVQKPSQFELVDNKWMIVRLTKDILPKYGFTDGILKIEGSMDQSIYMGDCDGVIVQITGKVNAISMNKCHKSGLVIDRAISSVDVTQCERCEVQIVTNVPVLSVDQSESVDVYLSKESMDGIYLYSSGCTALNVNIPRGSQDEEDFELEETAIPEQFVTTFSSGCAKTEAVLRG